MICNKIGLLGGTFNPVHEGHLQLAEAALREFALDKIVFIPAGHPPHKSGEEIASFHDRYSMLQLANLSNPQFTCSAIENDLPFPNYTIDTLRSLSTSFKTTDSFFFILGADSLLDLLSWKSYQDILQRVNIIVAIRPGFLLQDVEDFLRNLNYRKIDGCWQNLGSMKDIYLLNFIPQGFSSRNIRKQISEGKENIPGLPEAVVDYIKRHNLYKVQPIARKKVAH